MIKISEIIEQIDSQLKKEAFVPNPTVVAKQQADQMMQQIMQMVQGAPPEIQQQIAPQLQQIQQTPPEQQVQALQQLGDGLSQAQQQAQAPAQAAPGTPQDPSQSPQGGAAPANDIYNTTVSLTVKELLDLVSGGKASATHAKVQQLAQKSQIAQQKAEADAAQQQQDAQAAQAQQQAQSIGGVDMAGGGVYPQAPQGGAAPQQ